MKVEEPTTSYFSNDINMPLIEHVWLIQELGNMSKHLFYIGSQKQNPRTQTESIKEECFILMDQCLLKAI